MRNQVPAHHADELLFQLRLAVNAATLTGSETVACQHRERALGFALELDRWLSDGNPPPTGWCAAFEASLADGTVDRGDVALRAAESPRTSEALASACANVPDTAV